MKEKDKKRLAIGGAVAILVVIALAFAGLFSVVGLQGNRITFTNAPAKSAFEPTENPSFAIRTSAFSQSSYSSMATQYGVYIWITDIIVDGKDMSINPMASCGNDIFGSPVAGLCPVFTDCNIYGEGTKLCPGPCNSILVATPYGQKVNVSEQQILAYSLPQDKFSSLSPLAPGQHTVKVLGYVAASPTPPNTKGWTCESAAKSGSAAVWEDKFVVSGQAGGTEPINVTPPLSGGGTPVTINIPATITETGGTTTVSTPVGNVEGSSALFGLAIMAVVIVLFILAVSEGWILRKKKR